MLFACRCCLDQYCSGGGGRDGWSVNVDTKCSNSFCPRLSASIYGAHNASFQRLSYSFARRAEYFWIYTFRQLCSLWIPVVSWSCQLNSRQVRLIYLITKLTGPANCGKTFILNPLNVVYKTFSNPASTSFAWIGVENCEILFLNDFRWSSQILAWPGMTCFCCWKGKRCISQLLNHIMRNKLFLIQTLRYFALGNKSCRIFVDRF